MPTNTVVQSQEQRSQIQNREVCMQMLRARLYEMELEKQQAELGAERQSQIGHGNRSEKIRTYNFPQGRVTDHRIGLTLYKLDKIMNGDIEEIIDACASLYETKSFRDITIRDIGEKTSFTRTSIYNYYHSKEEIFLALLRREHEAWTEDLNGISRQYGKLSAEEFADKLARSLEKRGMYAQTDVHEHLRYGGQQPSGKSGGLQKVLCKRAAGCHVLPGKVFPSMTADNIQEFLYALFPFLFGVYPYTSHTEKQIQAMKMAHVHFISHSIYELVKPFAVRLLQSFSP